MKATINIIINILRVIKIIIILMRIITIITLLVKKLIVIYPNLSAKIVANLTLLIVFSCVGLFSLYILDYDILGNGDIYISYIIIFFYYVTKILSFR